MRAWIMAPALMLALISATYAAEPAPTVLQQGDNGQERQDPPLIVLRDSTGKVMGQVESAASGRLHLLYDAAGRPVARIATDPKAIRREGIVTK